MAMKISVGEHARRSTKPKIAYGQTTFESTQRVRDGLSVNEFDQLREDLGVPLGTLESTLSIAHRTLLRRRDTGRFQKDESDRLFRLRRLFDRAVEVLGDSRDAQAWMTAPQVALGGESPLSFADTDAGVREIENLLGRIEHGVFS